MKNFIRWMAKMINYCDHDWVKNTKEPVEKYLDYELEYLLEFGQKGFKKFY